MEKQTVEVVATEEKKGMSNVKKGLIGLGAAIGLGVIGLVLHRSKDKPVECAAAEPYAQLYVAPTDSTQE